MRLSRKSWNNYVARLSAINKTAGRKMQEWIDKNGTSDVDTLVKVAHALVTKYGEASSAAACDMYDMVAEAEGVSVPPAEPKATQNINYVNKAVRNTLDRAPGTIPSTVSEMVKRTGAETTLKNAVRDGAYFAWVPNGDTCPFCITLASNGWRRASRKTAGGDHAEHIHKNCDCEFAISFNGPGNIEGYDPDKYMEMYENAEGTSSRDKINSMRRAQYAANRDAINAQKRAAYANKKRAEHRLRGKDITKEYLSDADPGRGNLNYERNYNKETHVKEIQTAQVIHQKLGGNIILKCEAYEEKSADYEWMGTLWDLKTTTTEKAANSAIRHGMKQIANNPGGIILNFEDRAFDMPKLIETISRRMVWYPKGCADIIIISKGEIVKVLRY